MQNDNINIKMRCLNKHSCFQALQALDEPNPPLPTPQTAVLKFSVSISF